jgi:N4-(beta-N-acetylglucosaminyl)-L-asparaginase
MRRGAHPKDAGMTALKRIRANTVEKRLLTPSGKPNFGISFYVVSAAGEFAGVSMYAEESYGGGKPYKSKFAVCTERGPETLVAEPLLDERLVVTA